MSVDLRLRHDRLLREQAVEMFERGCGYRLTANRLGVPAEAVRHWQKTYRAIGKDGLLAMGVKQARYDYETKVAELSGRGHAVGDLLEAAGLARSSYYYALAHPKGVTRAHLRPKVAQIFSRTPNGCGHRQVAMCLRAEDG